MHLLDQRIIDNAPDERDAHIARIRAEGFPEYDIHPPGERDLYTSIVFLEPFVGRNLAAFGFDMYSEPTRRRAMLRAARLGETSITAKVTLMQETHGKVQAGVLLYVPVYRQGGPTDTPAQRMQALIGFVYSPYRLDDLMQGILRAADEALVSTDIIGESHSTVVDLPLISQVAADFFRVVGWYDNENAYALRCVDLAEYMVGRENA